MKLHRYFLSYFGGKLEQPWESRSGEIQGVRVSVASPQVADGCQDYRLVTATVQLDASPEIDNEKRILVPTEPRRKCEVSAWHAINLISVLESVFKQIYSPVGSVAFEAESIEEHEFLENSKGIFAESKKGESAAGFKIEWSPDISLALQDRMNGVALLSEAENGGEANSYREYVRFLELAFSLQFYDKRLARKLTQFLSSGAGGYTREEINRWVELRHPAFHADFGKSDWIATTENLREVTLRMNQACLDVVFNKQDWHNASNTRRNVWRPDAISTSSTGNVIVRKGSKAHFLFRVFDEFDVHPVKLTTNIDHGKSNLYAKRWQPEEPDDVH